VHDLKEIVDETREKRNVAKTVAPRYLAPFLLPKVWTQKGQRNAGVLTVSEKIHR
jgi:hypothetical protein